MLIAMVYVDIVLICILMSLGVLACGCAWLAWRARMRACAGRVLTPPPVLLRYSNESIDDSLSKRSTTVAYKHPLSGEYCVRKDNTRGYRDVTNPMWSKTPPSPDSGLSDQYEPLDVRPHTPTEQIMKPPPRYWNYTEYQI